MATSSLGLFILCSFQWEHVPISVQGTGYPHHCIYILCFATFVALFLWSQYILTFDQNNNNNKYKKKKNNNNCINNNNNNFDNNNSNSDSDSDINHNNNTNNNDDDGITY